MSKIQIKMTFSGTEHFPFCPLICSSIHPCIHLSPVYTFSTSANATFSKQCLSSPLLCNSHHYSCNTVTICLLPAIRSLSGDFLYFLKLLDNYWIMSHIWIAEWKTAAAMNYYTTKLQLLNPCCIHKLLLIIYVCVYAYSKMCLWLPDFFFSAMVLSKFYI